MVGRRLRIAIAAVAVLTGAWLASGRDARAAPIDDVEGAYRSSPAERDLARLLAGRAESASFVFHFRPGSAAEQGRAALEAKLEPAWKAVCARLEIASPRKVDVFIYETSAEMARLTGRPASEAAAAGEALHLALDRPSFGAALAKVAEPAWGRAGDKLGGGLEGGRWYKVRVACRSQKLEVSVDERKLSSVLVPAQPGAVGFGVEEGRLGVRGLKLRALPAEADAPIPPFTYPLRGEGASAWTPDVPGRWRIADEEVEGVRYGRMSRVRLGGAALRDVELDCEMRLSEGATGEVTLHATAAGATRVIFGPGAVTVRTPQSRLPITGPHPTLREGLAAAIAATLTAQPIHLLARALVEHGLAPTRDLARQGFPSGSTDRAFRQVLVGSFVLDALEKYGAARYRELHFADLVSTKTPLGELADLEADWRKRLLDRKFDPEELKRAERRLGLDVMAPVSAWREIAPAKLRTEGTGQWKPDDDELDWTGSPGSTAPGIVALTAVTVTRLAARATVRLGDGARAKLVLKDREGRTAAALLSTSGAQLLTPDNVAAAKSPGALEAGRWYDAALVLEAGAGRIYVDGELVAETTGGLLSGPGKLSIEMEGKHVEVKGVATRTLE